MGDQEFHTDQDTAQPVELRNVAIVAHVDHGKTSLVDQMLRQSGVFRTGDVVQERVLDTGELERERGITILAKATAIPYGRIRINVVDTPGHADFSGEVERVMRMVDGVLLVVDAAEGVMPQTKFVLHKALSAGLRPVVVLNKMDRPQARPREVLDEVYGLFIDLGATEEQLEFPVVYTSAALGTASLDPDHPGRDMRPLLDTIVQHVPPPDVSPDGPLQWQVAILTTDEFLGRIGIGRVQRGRMAAGSPVVVVHRDGRRTPARALKLFTYKGLQRTEVAEALAGDIVAVAGLGDITVGDTACDPNLPDPLPDLPVDEPTLQMTFRVNDSPFAGREGRFVTSRQLRSRLYLEQESDVSLRVEDTADADAFVVSSRGELHLAILLERLRREGYELQVSKPTVIVRKGPDGPLEPIEWLVAEVPDEYSGSVIEALGRRRGELQRLAPGAEAGTTRLEFTVPARGLIGFRSEFLTLTHGYGTYHHTFHKYGPWRGDIAARRHGVLVASESGVATAYALQHLEDRGVMFIPPGTEVYEGMIVGEHNRESDLTVNVTRQKHVTNMRSSTKEETVKLKTPREVVLDWAIAYIAEDELCEVTPKSVRLRKRLLSKSARERAGRG
ncbi:MAG: translational GTPase TypA [Alicyclobacillaceae bacterium]|nr:translational GTPase TypA [Alicyclobacillaceae bacterium]